MWGFQIHIVKWSPLNLAYSWNLQLLWCRFLLLNFSHTNLIAPHFMGSLPIKPLQVEAAITRLSRTFYSKSSSWDGSCFWTRRFGLDALISLIDIGKMQKLKTFHLIASLAKFLFTTILIGSKLTQNWENHQLLIQIVKLMQNKHITKICHY